MGDSEADKQREERRHRKAIRKGKSRQVEDDGYEYIDIDNVSCSSDDESDDELANGRRVLRNKVVDINIDKDDEVVEENTVRSSH